MGAVKASAAERKATEAEKERAHQLELTKLVLDWITVVSPKRGDILALTVPQEYFVYPGTAPEDVTDAQKDMMETAHRVLGTVIEGVRSVGVLMGGAAILGEGMTLADLPPPWEKHPDAKDPSEIAVPKSRILLPPGTKI